MRCFLLAAAFIACVFGLAVEDVKTSAVKHHKKHHNKHHGKHHGKHHHGKHHHHHHHGHHNVTNADEKNVSTASAAAPTLKAKTVSHIVTAKTVAKNATGAGKKEDSIVAKMKVLEAKLQKKKTEKEGHILVNGPVPKSFSSLFAKAVAAATGYTTARVTQTKPQEGGVVAVTFMASPHVVNKVEQEVTDPDSKLTQGSLHMFLVSKDDHAEEAGEGDDGEEKEEKAAPQEDVTPVQEKGIDIDTAMPYGDLEPFGREDTAQELTEDSVKESDEMVDQLERAEVAEEKRAVFRALTRLRGAAITSFDGVARSQTGNIDEYNKVHQWRQTHPLHHLADEESDISKWAFPDNADF